MLLPLPPHLATHPVARSRAALELAGAAADRLLSVLEREEIAGIRTLEAKISDAGPRNRRYEPHIVGFAKDMLVAHKRVAVHTHPLTGSNHWYAPARFSSERIAEKLDTLANLHRRLNSQAMPMAIGDALEISVFRALSSLTGADPQRSMLLGHFNLAKRRESGRYPKVEPPTAFNGTMLSGPPDFFYRPAGFDITCAIECKNKRDWTYPNNDDIKVLMRKAAESGCLPILITRRVPYLTVQRLQTFGLIIHETYNQLLPETDVGIELAREIAHKRSLGYFDVMASEQTLPRTATFLSTTLPRLLPTAAEAFSAHRDALLRWVSNEIDWTELLADAQFDFSDVPF